MLMILPLTRFKTCANAALTFLHSVESIYSMFMAFHITLNVALISKKESNTVE